MAKVRDWQTMDSDDVEVFERMPRQRVIRWDDEEER